jgi:hypothetical protein
MAATMYCDVPEHEHPADVIVTRLENGQTLAVCDQAYIELCRAVVAQADAAQADAAATQAAADEAEIEQADAEAIARLDHLDGHRPAPEPAPPVDPPGPTVVKRGTSRSRKAYQARQRAKTDKAAPEATGEPDGRPGASTEATGPTATVPHG